ncbi:hypothetical protein DBR06_SOUSAS3610028, partial [Sousa chinensis]
VSHTYSSSIHLFSETSPYYQLRRLYISPTKTKNSCTTVKLSFCPSIGSQSDHDNACDMYLPFAHNDLDLNNLKLIVPTFTTLHAFYKNPPTLGKNPVPASVTILAKHHRTLVITIIIIIIIIITISSLPSSFASWSGCAQWMLFFSKINAT